MERSWAPLSFFLVFLFVLSGLWLKLLCSCPCLLDAIVELHAMDTKRFDDFLIGK